MKEKKMQFFKVMIESTNGVYVGRVASAIREEFSDNNFDVNNIPDAEVPNREKALYSILNWFSREKTALDTWAAADILDCIINYLVTNPDSIMVQKLTLGTKGLKSKRKTPVVKGIALKNRLVKNIDYSDFVKYAKLEYNINFDAAHLLDPKDVVVPILKILRSRNEPFDVRFKEGRGIVTSAVSIL